jgi:hypothetical protein
MVGTARAADAQETPTQSHISPSILAYEDKALKFLPPRQGFDDPMTRSEAASILGVKASSDKDIVGKVHALQYYYY